MLIRLGYFWPYRDLGEPERLEDFVQTQAETQWLEHYATERTQHWRSQPYNGRQAVFIHLDYTIADELGTMFLLKFPNIQQIDK